MIVAEIRDSFMLHIRKIVVLGFLHRRVQQGDDFDYIGNSVELLEQKLAANPSDRELKSLQYCLTLAQEMRLHTVNDLMQLIEGLRLHMDPEVEDNPENRTPRASTPSTVSYRRAQCLSMMSFLRAYLSTGDGRLLDIVIEVLNEVLLSPPWTYHQEQCQVLLPELIEPCAHRSTFLNVHDPINDAALASFRGSGRSTMDADGFHTKRMPSNLLKAMEAIAVGFMLNNAFRETGDTDYLRNAIEVLEETVAAYPGIDAIQVYGKLWATSWKSDVAWDSLCDEKEKVGRMIFAELFGMSFAESGDIDFLDSTIMLLDSLARALPREDTDKHKILYYLSAYCSDRFCDYQTYSDVEKAIEAGEEAVALTSPGSPDYPDLLFRLSCSFWWRYKYLKAKPDLDHAVKIAEQAVHASNSTVPTALLALSTFLQHRGKKFPNITDLNESIKRSDQAILLADAKCSIPISQFLITSSMSYLARFRCLGKVNDVEIAIQRTENAIAAFPTANAGWLAYLGVIFYERYQRFGEPHDLARAMKEGQKAEELDSHNPDISTMVAILIGERAMRYGEPRDNDEAIRRSQDILARSDLTPYLRASNHHIMAHNFLFRFQRLRDMDDLSRAVAAAHSAFRILPPDAYERHILLLSLSTVLGNRYLFLRRPDDLLSAIRFRQDALAVISPDDYHRVIELEKSNFLRNLKFLESNDEEHLHRSIEISKRTLIAIPLDHDERADLLLRLSRMSFLRYLILGAACDIAQAIEMNHQGIAAIRSHNPNMAAHLKLQSDMLYIKYHQDSSCNPARTCQIIQGASIRFVDNCQSQEKQCKTPYRQTIAGQGDSMWLSRVHLYLGFSSAQIRAAAQCLDLNLMAWNCHSSLPRHRIQAAITATSQLAGELRWEEASSLIRDAVKLLPAVASQILPRVDQEFQLSQFSNLPSLAISIVLSAGSTASDCISLVELSRGILMGFAIDCRSDLNDLQESHPHFFNKIHRLRMEIDSPLVNTEFEVAKFSIHECKRRRRVEALREIDETLRAIHELPGFEGFQLPPCSADLMAMAREGPIAILNCHTLRSDAIIVTNSSIKSISLGWLNPDKVKSFMVVLARLAQGPRKTYPDRNRLMALVLRWLWKIAVEPVLKELGFLEPAVDDRKLPRIWWIGVGAFSRAPFHAAGDHSPGSTQNTISRTISSYIPSIKALGYAQQKGLNLDTDPRLLLVAMPTTPDTPIIVPTSRGWDVASDSSPVALPGTSPVISSNEIPTTQPKRWKPLPGVKEEVNKIAEVILERSVTTLVTILECPTVATVLEQLPAHNVIHFSCHGLSDATNPSNSRLVLVGDPNTMSGDLTVAAIANLNIKNAQIAYLSACSTADNASPDLADESIHMSSGFQLAGFSHVLAIMWNAENRACKRVSTEFYSLLFEGRSNSAERQETQSVGGHGIVSNAFHRAVKKLRDDNLTQPILWAPYIHTGA